MLSTVLPTILVMSALFAAVLVYLTSDSRFRQLTTRAGMAVGALLGILLYGYGYAACYGFSLSTVLRALIALARMFIGINDYAAISEAPLLQYPAVQALFWAVHFFACYSAASAAVLRLGDRFTARLRLRLMRHRPLLVIYGVNAQSLLYGQGMTGKGRLVLFVDEAVSGKDAEAIRAMGAVPDVSPDANGPGPGLLRKAGIRPGRRHVDLAVLKEDARSNLTYAGCFLDLARRAGLRPEQLTLLSRGLGQEAGKLQEAGFGSVWDFDPYDLTARIAVRENPPWDTLRFDETGRAAEDFGAVIVGFGRMGRAMLTQLILNGQFEGSTFRADVFTHNAQRGWPNADPLLTAYDIRLHDADADSEAFYAFLKERGPALRYIALCTGSERENAALTADIGAWLSEHGLRAALVQVTRDCLMGGDGRIRNIWAGDIPDIRRMDAMAMAVNSRYHSGEAGTPEEKWQRCDSFSRFSCRAAADFAPALLRAAGKSAEEALDGPWPPAPEILEHLAMTEHLRWCAFHRVMGYARMPDDVLAARAKLRMDERAREGRSGIRVTRDSAQRLHACLVPWEELDALSARVASLTDLTPDYKAMDRDNVLAIPDILRAAAAQKEERRHDRLSV